MAFLNAHAVWAHGPVLVYALLTLIDTHITTTCVTLYLHREQTHRSLTKHLLEETYAVLAALAASDPTPGAGAAELCE